MKQSRRRWLIPVVAAAAVALATAGIALASTSGDTAQPGDKPGPPSGPKAVATPGTSVKPLVRNGDRVEVTGIVIAAPGKPVVYCPDLPQALVGYPPGKEPPPSCPDNYAVNLTGVDLDRLANPGTRKGVRSGRATLRGTWHDRSIAVDEQTPPVPVPTTQPLLGMVPCAAPPGGWKSGQWGDAGVQANRLIAYVRSHPERFDDVRMGYPDGIPQASTAPPEILTEVIVVPLLTGDLEQTRRELGKLHGGNLCVYRATALFTRDELAKADTAMNALLRDRANGVWGYAPGSPTKRGEVDLLVLDERLYDTIDRIGFKYFDLKPSVRPVP